jgi:tetratricopeptide (TPR) repeat protein
MNGAALSALRTDRFKLIEAPRPELYDLAQDPGETRNRYADEPDTSRRLRAELERLTAGGAAVTAGPVDGDAVEKLRALGYIGEGGDVSATGGGKDPKDLIAAFNRLRRAERAVRDGRFEEALPVLRSLVEEQPDNAFVRMVLGSAFAGMRQHARALQEFRRYATLVPASAHARQSMAVAHANLGNETGALREAAAALELDPDLIDARLLRAGILARRGRRGEAVEELRAAVARAPQEPLLRLTFAELLLDAGRLAEAEAEYRAVLAQERTSLPEAAAPLLAEARFNLAGVLERQGRAAEARAEYEQVARAPAAPPPVRDAARRRLGLTP